MIEAKQRAPTILGACLLFGASLLHADDISDTGYQGQELGQQLSNEMLKLFDHSSGDNVSIPTLDDGNAVFDGSSSISTNELFPGTNPNNQTEPGDYFSGSGPDIEALKGFSSSDDAMRNAGSTARGSLFDDARSDSPSITGQAYDLLMESYNDGARPNLDNDPVMAVSRHTYANLDEIMDGFADCKVDDHFVGANFIAHKPDIQVCNREVDESQKCTMERDLKVGLIDNVMGLQTECKGEENCLEFHIRYYTRAAGGSGTANIGVRFEAVNPDAIIGAAISNISIVATHGHDAQVIYTVGGSGSYMINAVSTDIREIGDLEEGDYFSLRFGSLANERGHQIMNDFTVFGTFKLYYDPEKLVQEGDWRPKVGPQRSSAGTMAQFSLASPTSDSGCFESLEAAADGFASGEVLCVDDPADENGCITEGGITVCAEDLRPSPIESLSPTCKEVVVDVSYDWHIGEAGCYTDVQGNEQCISNDGSVGVVDTCVALENDPSCSFLGSQCVDGAQGESGRCYVTEERWDCGYGVEIETVRRESYLDCVGEIRCLGDDCLKPGESADTTQDLARVSALLDVAQFAAQDMNCEGAGGCKAFAGDDYNCKNQAGGVNNCCNVPTNITSDEYMSMIKSQLPKMDGAVMALDEGSAVRSGYQTLKDTGGEWADNMGPLVSAYDNISGYVGLATDPEAWLIEQAKEYAAEMAKETVQNMFAQMATDTVEQGAVDAVAGEAIAEMGMNMIGGLMTGFGYYQMAVAALQMLSPCDADAYERRAKDQLGACTFVGERCYMGGSSLCLDKRRVYCCYNSPLSRIIQEQVRGQLYGEDNPFGTARNPECGGIPLEELSEINWDQVNLDEWLAILTETGNMPNMKELSLEQLTGMGNELSLFGGEDGRPSADQRAVERMDGIDVEEVRRDAADSMPVQMR